MINPKEYLEAGQQFHGHKCPAMPLGMRVAAAAMNKLGVERAKDGQLIALIETGENHFATCFADGVQMITGCTFGKGNIQKLNYGKWGLTLIDKKSGKAVRITPKAETIANSKKSKFFTDYRSKGIPASQAPAEVVEPMIERVMNVDEEQILNIGEVFDYEWHDHPHTFESFICEECGEMVVETYGRIKGNKKVCIPCSSSKHM